MENKVVMKSKSLGIKTTVEVRGQFVSKMPAFLALVLLLCLRAAAGNAAIGGKDVVDLSGFKHRMKITFSGYTKSETLTNFPALVVFNKSLAGFDYSQFASVTGGDLRFVDSKGMAFLNYEIEKWSPDANSCVWVQVPEISGSTDYVWAYWGNAGQSTPPGYTTDGSMWSGEYAGVWHLSETSGTHSDSTANANNGTPENEVNQNASGQIDGADTFDGDNDQITLASILPIGSTSNTVTALVKVPKIGSGDMRWGERVGILLGNGGDDIIASNWELHNAGQMRIWWNSGEINEYGKTDLRDNNWHHIAWTRDKTAGKFFMYIDGSLEKTINASGSDITFIFTHKIGSDNRLGPPRFRDPPNWHGTIDELRISNVARSADWVWACWMSQKDKLSSYGTVELVPQRQ